MWDGEKITAPVSIEDVRQALGASSSDLGTLCRHPNIRKWSKHKPVYSKSVYIPYDSDEWVGGKFYTNGQFLDYPYMTSVNDLGKDGVNGNKVDISFIPPMQNGSVYFRLTDFNGYYDTASPPWMVGIDKSWPYFGDITVGITLIDEYNPELCIRYDDLLEMLKNIRGTKSLHIGVFLKNQTKDQACYFFNTSPISMNDEDTWYIQFHVEGGNTSYGDKGGISYGAGDVIDAFLFLAETPDQYSARYNPKLFPSDEAYRRFVVGEGPGGDTRQKITVTYSCVFRDVYTSEFYETMYYSVDDGEHVYSCKRFISGFDIRISDSIFSTGSGSVNLNPYNYVAQIVGTLNGRTQYVAPVTIKESSAGAHGSYTSQVELGDDTQVVGFYRTLEKAMQQGTPDRQERCIPIPDACLYSMGDADEEGTFSNRRLLISIYAYSRKAFTDVDIEGSNNTYNL